MLTGNWIGRRGGDCGSEGPGVVDKSLRAGTVPEDADMGTHERYAWFPLPSQYLDTGRYVLQATSNFVGAGRLPVMCAHV